MLYRRLGRTGLEVSEVGIGTWGIGGLDWGERDDERSKQALNHALDLGVNFIDTAYGYGEGRSEELIGEVLVSRPDVTPIVATKVPLETRVWPATDDMAVEDCYSPGWIRSCTEESLRRLGSDHIDLQQFHFWADSWTDQGQWADAVSALKNEGKIRFFGVSTNDHEPDSVLRLLESGLVDTVQVIYNLFDQSAHERLLPRCEELDIGVIARSPFDEGGLTGALRSDTVFAAGDWRRGYFKGGRLAETVARAGAVAEILAEHASSLAEGALRFCLSEDAVSTVIPGMRSPAHVGQNCAVSDGQLLESEVLEKLRDHSWPRNFYADAW
ncbi:MAG: aldo/keto reductase [Acidimicrobiia bacterium]|nr:aldo/keto reductase [bacterium]MXZ69323.1 aldo/keto reductase [Acidimicrobiia bacterium]MYB45014.1 aldo/keto reductase [Acidimicrobiia bacterium]MYC85086.1 aldo/keto reductase [Acidimicrobiia bacterium]